MSRDQGNVYRVIPGYTVEQSQDIFSQLLKVLCTPARIGSNYEASSTNDPLFWVLHPTIDRFEHVALGHLLHTNM